MIKEHGGVGGDATVLGGERRRTSDRRKAFRRVHDIPPSGTVMVAVAGGELPEDSELHGTKVEGFEIGKFPVMKEEYDWMLPHERVARHKTFNKDTPIHKPMFRHRDPATFEEDYAYFERCIERFRTLISSNAKKVFVKTYINRTPEDEKEALDDAIGLVKTLDKYTNNFKLVAIHISPVGKRQYGLKFSHNLIFCNLKTITESTGIDHTDEEDNVYLRQTFLNILKMI